MWQPEEIEVKPLDAPTGILYYMDYKYGETEEEKRLRIAKEELRDVLEELGIGDLV